EIGATYLRLTAFTEPVSLFQSPPHRGDRCDTRRLQAASTRRPVSVPSSSGRSVRRSKIMATIDQSVGFSPLLIGEIGATRSRLDTQVALPEVSVPSSSGRSVRRMKDRAYAWLDDAVSVPSSSGRSVRR